MIAFMQFQADLHVFQKKTSWSFGVRIDSFQLVRTFCAITHAYQFHFTVVKKQSCVQISL